jgi:hypothetical protein
MNRNYKKGYGCLNKCIQRYKWYTAGTAASSIQWLEEDRAQSRGLRLTKLLEEM